MFQCHVCGSTEARQGSAPLAGVGGFVSEVFELEGNHILVEDIPASVCVRCGEATFSRDTTEKIRRMVHGEAKPVKCVAMDVFAYV